MKYLLYFLFFFPLSMVAQNSETITVYFELDERRTFDAKVLDEALKSEEQPIDQIEIVGFADFLGSAEYNQQLSKDRALAVKSHIIERHPNLKIATTLGKGELPFSGIESEIGEPSHRRVEVRLNIAQKTVPSQKTRPKAIAKELFTETVEILEIDTTQEANIVLEGVGFIPGRHYPLPESKPKLDALLAAMKTYTTLKIEVQGFICCDYSNYDGMDNDTQTMNLSENRAKFIYDFLVREGIDSARLSYKGYGSSRPKVFPEVTEQDKQANRRVEIKVLK